MTKEIAPTARMAKARREQRLDMAMIRRISLLGLGVLTRRRAMMCITAAAGMQGFAARPACARLLLIQSVLRFVQPLQIALPEFLASSPADADPARTISQIITANLKRSEQFAPIDQAASRRSQTKH